MDLNFAMFGTLTIFYLLKIKENYWNQLIFVLFGIEFISKKEYPLGVSPSLVSRYHQMSMLEQTRKWQFSGLKFWVWNPEIFSGLKPSKSLLQSLGLSSTQLGNLISLVIFFLEQVNTTSIVNVYVTNGTKATEWIWTLPCLGSWLFCTYWK